jgi:hypothetical protein
MTPAARVLAVFLVVAAICSATTASASAPAGGQVLGEVDEDSAVLSGWANQEGSSAKGDVQQTGNAISPAFDFTYLPACSGNDPGVEGRDVGCSAADAACPGQDVMHWLFSRPIGGAGTQQWSFVATRCLGPGDPAAPRPVFPGFTLADFQRLPLPAGSPNIEPDNGFTLINVPTNVYAEAEPVTLDTQLIGFPVQCGRRRAGSRGRSVTAARTVPARSRGRRTRR